MIDISTGKEMTRGGFLKGILASGIAPSITLGAIAQAGSANASVGGMMRNVGARVGMMVKTHKDPYLLLSGYGQGLDTGIIGSSTFEHIFIDCNIENKNQGYSYLFAHKGETSSWCACEIETETSLYNINAGRNVLIRSNTQVQFGKRLKIDVLFRNNLASLTENGILKIQKNFTGGLQYGNIMLYTTRNNSFYANGTPIGKIYATIIYDSQGNEIMNLTPKRDANGYGYMYDSIGGRDYHSAGTSQFGYGEE